jgi:hypothetical protein
MIKHLLISLCAAGCACAALSEPDLNRIADGIYRIEGGAKTRHPYGVLSVRTKDPRRVCIVSIKNNYKRWETAGRPGRFGDFMADRWCPASADAVGNRNWKSNFQRIVGDVK